jgi:glycine/D-amino acid oxidase-like deaminating enzyme
VNRETDGTWKVETPRGAIKAKKVVLATNGYTGFLCEKFRKIIVPLRGQITAHRPGGNMPAGGLPTTYSFIYKNGYEYMIPRPQGSKFAGDIIMGGGLVKAKDEGIGEFGTMDDTTINKEISAYLTATTPRYFGENWGEDDKEGRIRKEWTGIMGYSSDGFPFIGEVPGEVRCLEACVKTALSLCKMAVLTSWIGRTVDCSELSGTWHGAVLFVCESACGDDEW